MASSNDLCDRVVCSMEHDRTSSDSYIDDGNIGSTNLIIINNNSKIHVPLLQVHLNIGREKLSLVKQLLLVHNT